MQALPANRPDSSPVDAPLQARRLDLQVGGYPDAEPFVISDPWTLRVLLVDDIPCGGLTPLATPSLKQACVWGEYIFRDYVYYQVSGPNNETFPFHPLFAAGVRGNGAYRLLNSSLPAQIFRQDFREKDANVSIQDIPAYGNHFVIRLSDTSVEVVAGSVEAHRAPLPD